MVLRSDLKICLVLLGVYVIFFAVEFHIELKKPDPHIQSNLEGEKGAVAGWCEIAVVVAASLDSLQGQRATINSIIHNYADDRNLCIFVFSTTEDVPHHKKNINLAFDSLLKNRINVRIAVKTFDTEQWHPEIFSENSQGRKELDSPYNWSRYYLKPHDVGGCNRVVYLDIDTICQTNIAEMYDLDLEGNIAAGVLYGGPLSSQLCHESKDVLNKVLIGKDRISPFELESHFNAGVMLLDLEAFSEQGVLKEWSRLLSFHKKKCLWHLQQAAFTLAARGMFLILPEEWNLGNLGWIKGKDNVAKCETAKILHWNGPNKPWKVSEDGGTFCADIWYKYHITTKDQANELSALPLSAGT